MTNGAGKGDQPRPYNRERYEKNYTRIFQTSDLEAFADFQRFQKIPRLYRDIIITEKIDGTNAQIYIPEGNGPILAGSRKRWLRTDQEDNFGFGAWVREHADELQQLGPGRHFGEWWGRGINRGYGLDHRRFSLFNVSRWYDNSHDPGGAALNCLGIRTPVPPCCHVVPILWIGPFYTRVIQRILCRLQETGSYAAPGFMKPEGIVIYHTAGNCCFKVTIENDSKPKGKAND